MLAPLPPVRVRVTIATRATARSARTAGWPAHDSGGTGEIQPPPGLVGCGRARVPRSGQQSGRSRRAPATGPERPVAGRGLPRAGSPRSGRPSRWTLRRSRWFLNMAAAVDRDAPADRRCSTCCSRSSARAGRVRDRARRSARRSTSTCCCVGETRCGRAAPDAPASADVGAALRARAARRDRARRTRPAHRSERRRRARALADPAVVRRLGKLASLGDAPPIIRATEERPLP